MRRFETTAKILVVRLIALILIISGLVLFPLPIPFGLIFIIIGLTLMISSSKTLARSIRNYRKSHPDLDEKIRIFKDKAPAIIRRPLEITEPEYENNG